MDALKAGRIHQAGAGGADVHYAVPGWRRLETRSFSGVAANRTSVNLNEGAWCAGLPADLRTALKALPSLYGTEDMLAEARRQLPDLPVRAALDDLGTLARHARQAHAEVRVGFDLADVGGSSYYSGARFAIYAKGSSDAIARGGRYDEVGAIFGRNRPARWFQPRHQGARPAGARRGGRAAVRCPGRKMRAGAPPSVVSGSRARRSSMHARPRARRPGSSSATESWSQSPASGAARAVSARAALRISSFE